MLEFQSHKEPWRPSSSVPSVKKTSDLPMVIGQSQAKTTALQLPGHFASAPRFWPPLSIFSILMTPFEERIHETDSGTTKAATST